MEQLKSTRQGAYITRLLFLFQSNIAFQGAPSRATSRSFFRVILDCTPANGKLRKHRKPQDQRGQSRLNASQAR